MVCKKFCFCIPSTLTFALLEITLFPQMLIGFMGFMAAGKCFVCKVKLQEKAVPELMPVQR